MKIFVIKSVRTAESGRPDSQSGPYTAGPYTVTSDTAYAGRFLSHIRGEEGYCHACGDGCRSCRAGYDLDFSDSISGILEVPETLPVMIDDPQEFLPEIVPDHDVLVAVGVNEEVLKAFVETHPVARGVIVPIEGSSWISPYAVDTISKICKKNGVECAFPKPFCSFDPETEVLKAFRREFRIGKPDIEYRIEGGVITGTKVRCSAPCGATYFTARRLEKRRLDEDLTFVIDSALSAYPCTADRAVDREFGDSITHQAVKIQRCVLRTLGVEVRK
jgi:hypothetical protein